jgi:hypothetical protein
VTVGHNSADMYVPALFAGNTNITGTTTTSGLTTANGGLNVNGDTNVSGNITNTGMLNANGNMTISNSNPYISFLKSGIAPANAPQLYSDGSTIHAYNGHFQVDNDLTIGGNLTGSDRVGFIKLVRQGVGFNQTPMGGDGFGQKWWGSISSLEQCRNLCNQYHPKWNTANYIANQGSGENDRSCYCYNNGITNQQPKDNNFYSISYI